MKKVEIEKRIIEHFENKKYFSRKELLEFYNTFEKDLNNRTFGWRVWDLKKKNIIRSVGTGIYTTEYKPDYVPSVDNKLKKIYNTIAKSFAIIDKNLKPKEFLSVWPTDWLNEFINHQLFLTIILVEIESNSLTSYYYRFVDAGFKNVYVDPDFKMMEKYVSENKESIVVKKMPTRSPNQKIEMVSVPTLEKILVDVFCDKSFFYFVQGQELENIYKNSINKYSIDFSKLINYVKRRKRENDFKNFLSQFIGEELKELVY